MRMVPSDKIRSQVFYLEAARGEKGNGVAVILHYGPNSEIMRTLLTEPQVDSVDTMAKIALKYALQNFTERKPYCRTTHECLRHYVGRRKVRREELGVDIPKFACWIVSPEELKLVSQGIQRKARQMAQELANEA